MWDPGFRLGLGWNTDCDGWDLYLNWTYYHNRSKKSTEFPLINADFKEGERTILDPWTAHILQRPDVLFSGSTLLPSNRCKMDIEL